MALQSSGTISLLDIQTEFGGANPISLSEYYGADTGVPASGQISLSDFYGKSSVTNYPITNGFFLRLTNSNSAPSLYAYTINHAQAGLVYGSLYYTTYNTNGTSTLLYVNEDGTGLTKKVAYNSTSSGTPLLGMLKVSDGWLVSGGLSTGVTSVLPMLAKFNTSFVKVWDRKGSAVGASGLTAALILLKEDATYYYTANKVESATEYLINKSTGAISIASTTATYTLLGRTTTPKYTWANSETKYVGCTSTVAGKNSYNHTLTIGYWATKSAKDATSGYQVKPYLSAAGDNNIAISFPIACNEAQDKLCALVYPRQSPANKIGFLIIDPVAQTVTKKSVFTLSSGNFLATIDNITDHLDPVGVYLGGDTVLFQLVQNQNETGIALKTHIIVYDTATDTILTHGVVEDTTTSTNKLYLYNTGGGLNTQKLSDPSIAIITTTTPISCIGKMPSFEKTRNGVVNGQNIRFSAGVSLTKSTMSWGVTATAYTVTRVTAAAAVPSMTSSTLFASTLPNDATASAFSWIS